MNAFVPEAVDLTSRLGLRGSCIDLGPGVQRRYLLSAGKLSGIDASPFGFFTSNYLSLPGRLTMMAELFRPRGTSGDDESIYDFAARRFGTEFAAKVMEPLAAGLFAGDARELSVCAVFPKLVEFEERYGSITRGVIANRRGKHPGKRLFSWPGGMATLPQRLAKILGDRVRTGVTVKRISRRAGGFVAETSSGTFEAQAIVLAVQPHVARQLLEPVDQETAAAVSKIAAPPLSVVFLGYERAQIEHRLDGLGFLSTKGNSQIITGAQFCSTMFSGRAPEGFVSIASYVGGARNPAAAQLREHELVSCVESELKDLLAIRGPAIVRRTRHWSRGIPQYAIGHGELIKTVESSHERVPGLFLAGNYLRGVSVANCLATGRRVAAKVDGFLPSTSSGNLTEGPLAAQFHS